MLTRLLILSVPVTAVALLYARWEYRRRGQLSLLGLFLLCAMIFVPNLMLDYATSYRLPGTPLGYLGVALALLVSAVSLHLLVLVEEEHLRRQFGAAYLEFCQRVPRYFALGRPH